MQPLTINPKFRDVARPLHEDEFKRPMLVSKLKKLDPVILLREAKSITRQSSVGCARMFVRAYNRKLIEKSRLEEKL